MSTLRKLPNNKFRTEVRKKLTTIKSKNFPTRHSAEAWGNELDRKIDLILEIEPIQLKELSPEQIDE